MTSSNNQEPLQSNPTPSQFPLNRSKAPKSVSPADCGNTSPVSITAVPRDCISVTPIISLNTPCGTVPAPAISSLLKKTSHCRHSPFPKSSKKGTISSFNTGTGSPLNGCWLISPPSLCNARSAPKAEPHFFERSRREFINVCNSSIAVPRKMGNRIAGINASPAHKA